MDHYCSMAKTIKPRRPGSIARPRAQQKELDQTVFLAEWFEALGVRPAKVAAGSGRNEGYLSSLKRGSKANPSPAFLKDIAKELGLPDWRVLYYPPPSRAELEKLRKYGSSTIERLGKDPK